MNMQIKNNPDQEKYVKTIQGYALKPKQCPKCKGLFVPLKDSSIECTQCENPFDFTEKCAYNLRQRINYCRKIGAAGKIKELMDQYFLLTGKVITFRK